MKHMVLSRYTLKKINAEKAVVPEETLFDLPEKVLQFGTGVLLRGLIDYFIDKANRQGIFNGRVVVVKSTGKGDTTDFDKQDGLYTLCVRGFQNGETVEENIINSSISRVLNAAEEWEKILECAHNQNMQVIISNTTEVGIQLVNEDIRKHPPVSFPGKLLAFLYERFHAFSGSAHSGMVIIPTELISDNGKKLESILLELAHLNGLEEEFIEWLEKHNRFCNSLVDRIVPGKPDAEMQSSLEEELGYTDGLMIISEVYRLWAIEGDDHVKNVLSFAKADEGVVIVPDITLYKELKLRLLNATHTLSCGLAYLSGFNTVKEAMDDEAFFNYVKELMLQEVAPAIPYKIEPSVSRDFGLKVLDRFRNPKIKHQWIHITVQYTSKLRMRVVPLLLTHYKQNSSAPALISLGFAAYILFTKPQKQEGDKLYGNWQNEDYPINDDLAASFLERWNNLAPEELVNAVLKDVQLWDEDLSALPGFHESVLKKLNLIMDKGPMQALAIVQTKKESVS
jgi:tagaturonate reductase